MFWKPQSHLVSGLKVRIAVIAGIAAFVLILSDSRAQDPLKQLPRPTPPNVNSIKDAKDTLEEEAKEVERIVKTLPNFDPPNAQEEIWGQAGRVAYVAAAKVMAKRSPTGEPMPDDLKESFKRHFGGLVDRVTLHWGTPCLDEWAASRFSVRLTKDDSDAQVYGHDIYIRWRKDEQTPDAIFALLAHELVHSQQFERFGESYSEFGYQYFKEFKKAGRNYDKNKLEVEAHKKATEITCAVDPKCLDTLTPEQLKHALERLSRDQLAAVLPKIEGGTLRHALKRIDGPTLQVAVDVMDPDTLRAGMERVDGSTLSAILKRLDPKKRADVLPRLNKETRGAAERRREDWR